MPKSPAPVRYARVRRQVAAAHGGTDRGADPDPRRHPVERQQIELPRHRSRQSCTNLGIFPRQLLHPRGGYSQHSGFPLRAQVGAVGGCFGISTKKLTRTMPGELRLLSFRTEDFGYHSARKHKETDNQKDRRDRQLAGDG